jgi:hypothetical protein
MANLHRVRSHAVCEAPRAIRRHGPHSTCPRDAMQTRYTSACWTPQPYSTMFATALLHSRRADVRASSAEAADPYALWPRRGAAAAFERDAAKAAAAAIIAIVGNFMAISECAATRIALRCAQDEHWQRCPRLHAGRAACHHGWGLLNVGLQLRRRSGLRAPTAQVMGQRPATAARQVEFMPPGPLKGRAWGLGPAAPGSIASCAAR